MKENFFSSGARQRIRIEFSTYSLPEALESLRDELTKSENPSWEGNAISFDYDRESDVVRLEDILSMFEPEQVPAKQFWDQIGTLVGRKD